MEVNPLQKLIVIVVVWIFVPIILFGLFMLSRSIVEKAKNGEHKLSTRAGFWAGLIALVSCIIGYFFLLLLKITIPTRMAGFVVLLLVFSSLSALFSYFFIQSINDVLMSFSLGIAFGVLIHIIIAPKMINDIFANEEINKNSSVSEVNKNT